MTTSIMRFGNSVPSVFALAGWDENSATGALGWALSQSPTLLRLVLTDLRFAIGEDLDARIELQRRADDAGFTDIEIHAKNLVCVIEAKIGIAVASEAQLQRYVERMGGAGDRVFLSVSDAPASFAARSLPPEILGVAVKHWTWRDVQSRANQAAGTATSPIEKLWLRQLKQHLEKYVTGNRITDNTVYVVSLSDSPIEDGNSYTWVDVPKEGRYFHPAGRGWPVEPPNYIGFRYDGKLQAIHHVEDWKIVNRLKDESPLWPERDQPYFVYQLGPAIIPAVEVRSGAIRNARSYVAIDLLLSGTCKTISEAVAATKGRIDRAAGTTHGTFEDGAR
jgi:hypothetical protein